MIALFLFLGMSGLSYMFVVGISALLLWLARELFSSSFEPNIWLFGLFIWIILFTINLLRK